MSIKRYQLFEFSDLDWVPLNFKDTLNDYLYIFWTFAPPKSLVNIAPSLEKSSPPIYSHIVKPMTDALMKIQKRTDKEVIVLDCCSGTGGPTPLLAEKVNENEELKPIKFYLSDIFPRDQIWKQISKTNQNVSFVGSPVDVACVNTDFEGGKAIFRTINLSFHQFDNFNAKRILKDCLDKDEGFMITELVQRDRNFIIYLTVLLPLLMWLLTPILIRPLTLSKLFFVYVVPITVFLMVFDAVVSCLRTRTHDETRKMMQGLKTKDWEFKHGVQRGLLPFSYIQYYIGIRKKAKA